MLMPLSVFHRTCWTLCPLLCLLRCRCWSVCTSDRPSTCCRYDNRPNTHRVSLSGGLCRHTSAFFQICVQGLLPAAEDKQGSHGDVGRLFVFAVMWSLGALLELEDRAKMEAYLTVCLTLVPSCPAPRSAQPSLSFDLKSPVRACL